MRELIPTDLPPRVRVAVNAPVDGEFDYALPSGKSALPGARVKVRFGRQNLIGVVTREVPDDSPLPPGVRLRPLTSVLDKTPFLAPETRRLVEFAARYYHHPVGEVYATALPSLLRSGKDAKIIKIFGWKITDEGRQALASGLPANATRQKELLDLLKCGEALTRDDFIGLAAGWRDSMKGLVRKGWVERLELTSTRQPDADPTPGFELTEEQSAAVSELKSSLGQFRPFLLDGVTGSGKTEVYIQAAQHAIECGYQVLVLVPEIGLTPQTANRFRSRLPTDIVLFHSGLTDRERADAWLRAQSGSARVIIGTRSAVFTPLPKLGLIIIDEEHDRSYKSHEGFRYNARDLAVWRAQDRKVPIVLGSATPSPETERHARERRYERLLLPHRVGRAGQPDLEIVPLGKEKAAFHAHSLDAIRETIGRGDQALVFLNRRGYSPIIMCSECGHPHPCRQCDVPMVLHNASRQIRCHWCGEFDQMPRRCDECGNPSLIRVGHGTERLDETLAAEFPDVPVVRIDRDTTRSRSDLEDRLAVPRTGKPCILVGTQMLTKGHHLPDLTLVVVVDTDGALFSTELRAAEWLSQTLVQVAGRAGRTEKQGKVLVQTRCPENDLLRTALFKGYRAALDSLLATARDAGLPPYGHLAVLRFSCPDPTECERFGKAARACAPGVPAVRLAGPSASPRERIAGRWQHHFLINADARPLLHSYLGSWVQELRRIRRRADLRWSLDVDPYELSG